MIQCLQFYGILVVKGLLLALCSANCYLHILRGGGAGGGPGGVGGAGAAASGGDRAPPSWDFRNSPARSDTDLSR